MVALVTTVSLGCAHLNKWPIENKLKKAGQIREEVSARTEAEQVKAELDQSAEYQVQAERMLEKARSRPNLDLEGSHQRYVARAEEYADLSLEAAEAARSKLPPLPEEGQAGAGAGPRADSQAMPGAGDEVREGPPGPLSLEAKPQEEEASSPSPALDQAKIPEQDLSPLSPPASEERPPAIVGPAPMPQAAALEAQPPRPLADSASLEPPLPAQPEELYKKGLALCQSGAYPESRRHLVAFLSRFPGHPLAVNAQYWIGETYYSVGEYVLALGAFEAVVQRYPKSSKAPDGLLKVGLTELKLGRKVKALESLRECVALFPASNPASIARQYLARLGE